VPYSFDGLSFDLGKGLQRRNFGVPELMMAVAEPRAEAIPFCPIGGNVRIIFENLGHKMIVFGRGRATDGARIAATVFFE
jgi:hypothetical protein